MNQIAQYCAYYIIIIICNNYEKCCDRCKYYYSNQTHIGQDVYNTFFETNDASVRLQVLFIHTLWHLRYARVQSTHII
jgi:hypothetical protein